MERLESQRPTGMSRPGLRMWGYLFLTIGVIGRSIFQHQLLGLESLSAQELLAAMERSDDVMVYATAAIVMQALETCAVPIFAFFLAEGLRLTQDLKQYFLRMAGLAIAAELPYNWAMSGKLLDLSSRNPVFSLVIAMVAVYFFQRYEQKTLKDIAVRVLVVLAAILWCMMLGVEYGACVVLTALVMWLLWDKPIWRNFAGATVVLVFSAFSMFMLAAPMSFLAIHFYNGEKGSQNSRSNYLFYPALLLIAGLAGTFLF